MMLLIAAVIGVAAGAGLLMLVAHLATNIPDTNNRNNDTGVDGMMDDGGGDGD